MHIKLFYSSTWWRLDGLRRPITIGSGFAIGASLAAKAPADDAWASLQAKTHNVCSIHSRNT